MNCHPWTLPDMNNIRIIFIAADNESSIWLLQPLEFTIILRNKSLAEVLSEKCFQKALPSFWK